MNFSLLLVLQDFFQNGLFQNNPHPPTPPTGWQVGNPGGGGGGWPYALEIQMGGGAKEVWKSRWEGGGSKNVAIRWGGGGGMDFFWNNPIFQTPNSKFE